EDADDLLLRVDGEARAAEAHPQRLARRAGHHREALLPPYREAEAEAVAGSCRARRHVREARDVVRQHVLDRLARQQPRTVEGTAVPEQLPEAEVIRRRRHRPPAAFAVPLPRVRLDPRQLPGLRLERVGVERVGQAGHLLWLYLETRVLHLKWLED